MKHDLSIVMLGATGAVGAEVLKSLLPLSQIDKITLLGRRPVADIDDKRVQQHAIDIFEPSSYANFIKSHNIAICTLGVGQPSKISKEDFIKIDKEAVFDFATACKSSGVRHFQLLSSVGISAQSSSFFLKTKGELVEALKALHFERLSIFQPSMILTPNNRYGFSQGVILKVWPLLHPILFAGAKKYRGIQVARLGEAMANNVIGDKIGLEYLIWDDFQLLSART